MESNLSSEEAINVNQVENGDTKKLSFLQKLKKEYLITISLILILIILICISYIFNNRASSKITNSIPKYNQTQSSTRLSPTPNPYNPITPSDYQSLFAKTVCTNPNQQKIAFTLGGDIWAMNIDGTCAKQLTHYLKNCSPELSPKGDYIAYYSVDQTIKNTNNNACKSVQYPYFTGLNIYIIKVDGSNAVKLTDSNVSVLREDLQWSPNGNQLMYMDDKKIIIQNPDGSGKKVLVDLNTIQGIYVNSAEPYWTPDGSQIVVTASSGPGGEGSPAFTQVLLYNLDGVLDHKYTYSIPIAIEYWSPDNKLYFFDESNGIGVYGLESINLDGTNRTLVSGSNTLPLPAGATTSALFQWSNSVNWDNNLNVTEVYQNWVSAAYKTISDSIPIHIKWFASEEIKWTPDNKHLFFTTTDVTNKDRPVTLYTINEDGSGLKVLIPTHILNPNLPDDDEFSTGANPLY